MEWNLKPCPFCGAEDAEPWLDDYDNDIVFCRHCQAVGPARKTQAQAIKAWNTRKGAKKRTKISRTGANGHDV